MVIAIKDATKEFIKFLEHLDSWTVVMEKILGETGLFSPKTFSLWWTRDVFFH